MIVRSDFPSVWEQVDDICEQMHCTWDSDAPRRVEEWLAQYPDVAAEPEAVFDLIYTEYLLEEPQGAAGPVGLNKRFPEFAERLRRQILVHEALQKTVDHHDDPTLAGGVEPSSTSPGSSIGKFRIEEELGRGGMGIVYRAHDTQLQRDVALKVLKSGDLADKFEVRRFENEMAAAASLDHPHIVPVLEVGHHAGWPYFVMKLIGGGSLAGRLGEFTGQPRRCAEFLLPIATAVQHMHLQGILHRDLKPSNILIDQSGQPQVTDFGLARADQGTSQLTASGDVLGTLPYLAPELVEQSSPASSVLSDVYGLGALLYTLLVGKWPHDAHTPAEIIRRITSESVPPPRRIDPTIPRDLQTICLKALERRPADRYQSAGQLADELQRYLEDRPIEARPVGPLEASWKWMRRNPWSAAVAGLLALLTIALLGVTTVGTWHIHDLNALLKQELQNVKDSQAEAKAQAGMNRNLAYAADLRLASVAYHGGDSQQTIEILNRYLPTTDTDDVRGFEWHLLRNLTDRPFKPLGETGEAGYFITISPDGQLVAVGGQSGRITIYDVTTQEQELVIDSKQGEVNGLAYSPDGTQLASVGDDGTARLWDLSTGQQILSIQAHADEAFQVTFAAQGEQVITCGKDPVIRIWDLPSGAAHGMLIGHAGDVEAIAMSPDGQLLASVGNDRTFRVWRISDQSELPGARWELDARGSSVAFSPDGALVAAGGLYGVITVARISELQESKVVRIQNRNPVQSLTFLSDARSLLVGDRAGMLSVYFISDGLPADNPTDATLSWRGHTDRVYGLAASANTNAYASISRDGTARLWRGTGDEHGIQPLTTNESIWDVAILPDGHTAITLSGNDHVTQWDLSTGRKLSSILVPADEWLDMDLLRRDRLVLVDSDRILLWDMSRQSPVAERPLPEQYEDGGWISASPSADYLAIWPAKQDVPALLLDAQTLQTLAEIPTDAAFHLAWHPHRPLLAVQSHSDVVLWDAVQQRSLNVLPENAANVSALRFSPYGRFLAVARTDRSIDIWDLEAGQCTLTGHVAGPMARTLAFTPDEKTLLVGDAQNRAAYAWHVPTGRPLGLLARTAGAPRRIEVTSDGKTAILVADGQTLLLQGANGNAGDLH